MNKTHAISVLLLTISFISADEHEQHGAHEHGSATMGIAQDANLILIEFDSPAFNIVGFEHTPHEQHELESVKQAQSKLEQGAQLFYFPKKANCQLVNVELHSTLFDSLSDEHLDHGHEADHESEVEDEDRHHHSELEAVWSFNCQHPEFVSEINTTLFSLFGNLTELDVDFIVDSGQGSIELTSDKTLISF